MGLGLNKAGSVALGRSLPSGVPWGEYSSRAYVPMFLVLGRAWSVFHKQLIFRRRLKHGVSVLSWIKSG